MHRPTVAITACTSFTGSWIVEQFCRAGWRVLALCSRRENDYSGLPKKRLEFVKRYAEVFYGLKAEGDRLRAWIANYEPEFWVHHHHWMENYRRKDYDLQTVRLICIDPLPDLLAALAKHHCRALIYSGSFFEPGEGGQNSSAEVTPYARSKMEVWNALKNVGQTLGLPCSKIVIPNPIGPFENEDRFIPQMILHSKENRMFTVSAPHYSTDYLPADLLGSVYVRLCEEFKNSKDGICERILRPSGKIEALLPWAHEVANELIRKRLKREIELRVVDPAPPAAIHQNPQAERLMIDWEKFWNRYAELC